jgi:endonuclease YncB( thermonuclease family)
MPRLAVPSQCPPRSTSEKFQHIIRHKPISCHISESIIFYKPFQLKIIESTAKFGLSLAASFLLITAPPALGKEDCFGIPRVIDGDTIVINGTRIRLFGIDAPESKQSCTSAGKAYECGTASKNALVEKIGSAPVRCAVKRKDMYGRSVAICKLEEGLDLNAWLVKEGWAVAYSRYSQAYVPLEAQAQEERKGIWSGNFENPEKWRKEHSSRTGAGNTVPEVAVPATTAVAMMEKEEKADVAGKAGGVAVASFSTPTAINSKALLPDDSTNCLIKGNITAKGAKIYHVPGGRFYDSTKINTKAGEKFFCSQEEAVAAGWRASKG